MKNIVLLTATIAPAKGVPALAMTDAVERSATYLAAFEFYLSKIGVAFDGIVFAENSGADITEFQNLAEFVGEYWDV